MAKIKDIDGFPNFDKYKTRVTLCFKSQKQKRAFLGQLDDGWGENLVDLNWPMKTNIHNCEMITVKVAGEDLR